MPGNFFDSNVPLYLAAGADEKAERAEALLADGGWASVQVLNEVANVGLRKFDMTVRQVEMFLAGLRDTLEIVPVTTEVHDLGLRIRERHRFAFYDCCIIAAALLAECDTLWSEDMHAGLVIDGRLTIRNPFTG